MGRVFLLPIKQESLAVGTRGHKNYLDIKKKTLLVKMLPFFLLPKTVKITFLKRNSVRPRKKIRLLKSVTMCAKIKPSFGQAGLSTPSKMKRKFIEVLPL